MKKKRLPKGFRFKENRNLYEYRFIFDEKRYSVYGETQKECEQKADDLKSLLKESLHIENQKITLKKFYNSWIEEQAQGVKQSTIYAYSKSWKYLNTYLGEMKISKIEKSDIVNFQAKMKAVNKSADTINKCVRLLRQILKAAINDRIINFNPAETVKMLKTDKPKATDSNHRALTETETAFFLENAKECHYYNLFRFLLNTGVRIGEALALQWADIDYINKTININKTVARVDNKGYEIFDSPKTESSNRNIPLTSPIIAILKDQKEQNEALQIKDFENRIFTNSRGKTSNYNAVNVCIENIIRKINADQGGGGLKVVNNFQHFSVHALRDTFATRCIEQGMKPHTLKAILGHSSLKMTMDLYAHVMPNTKYSELEKIHIAV